MSLKHGKDILFELLTADGNKISLKKLNALSGKHTNKLNLNEGNRLSKGIYYLQALGMDRNPIKQVIIR